MSDITPVRRSATRGRRAGSLEVAAVILLLAGGAACVVGWFAGVALLWASPRWRWTDKLLGTLIWPGGLAALAAGAFVLAFPSPPAGCDPPIACLAFATGPPLWLVGTVFALLVVAQFAVAGWLLRCAGARAPAPG
jgi:hypothetical protein